METRSLVLVTNRKTDLFVPTPYPRLAESRAAATHEKECDREGTRAARSVPGVRVCDTQVKSMKKKKKEKKNRKKCVLVSRVVY